MTHRSHRSHCEDMSKPVCVCQDGSEPVIEPSCKDGNYPVCPGIMPMHIIQHAIFVQGNIGLLITLVPKIL